MFRVVFSRNSFFINNEVEGIYENKIEAEKAILVKRNMGYKVKEIHEYDNQSKKEIPINLVIGLDGIFIKRAES